MNLSKRLYSGDKPGDTWIKDVKNFLCIQFGEGAGGGTMAAVCVKDRQNKEDLQQTLDYLTLFQASPRLLAVLRMIAEANEDEVYKQHGNFAMWAKSLARTTINENELVEVGLDGSHGSEKQA